MPLADHLLTLRRDVHSGEVLARGGAPEAPSVLQRTGFVLVARLHEHYHRLPTGLDEGEEQRRATRAVARLRAVHYHVDCDEAFDTGRREPYELPLGAQVAHLAERLRQATTTDDAADILTELTATHDGVLTALGDVLVAAADFYEHLGQPSDRYTAKRLRHLAEKPLQTLWSDLAHTRNDLADRHQPHTTRRPCTAETGPGETEASAVRACPPPQIPTIPSALPTTPAPTGRRR
ncbi:hypothetical protein [Streptomyces sp. NPDC012510]|uniref:hypothetical protein n=1 Tax=Streptomyces sp. NPDC012510 TaxID=3364838 RepID=UPI0036E5DC1D